MKPLFYKVGVALAISIAGFLVAHFKIRNHLKRQITSGGGDKKKSVEGAKEELESMQDEIIETGNESEKEESMRSPNSKGSVADDDGFLLPEFPDLVCRGFELNGFGSPLDMVNNSKLESEITARVRVENTTAEMEVEELRKQVLLLQERERHLELKLLEYYGLKEQDNEIKEFEKRLRFNAMETKIFALKLQSAQSENKRLQEQVANHSKIKEELENAKHKIKVLKKKLKEENEEYKSQLTSLRERVSAMKTEENELNKEDDDEYKKMANRMRDLEHEVEILKKMNERLQQENSEFSLKLEQAEAIDFPPHAEINEAQFLGNALEELHSLRESNEKLVNELEKLNDERCSDLQDLVYLKWINACLRYELRHHQPPEGKSARDLSTSLSPRSEELAKKLILEYAGSGSDERGFTDFDSEVCSTSQASTITDTEELDDAQSEYEHSKQSHGRRPKLFEKLRKLILGKYTHHIDKVHTQGRSRNTSGNSTPYSSGLPEAGSKSMRADSETMERVASRNVVKDEIARTRPSLDLQRKHVSIGEIKEYPFMEKVSAHREGGSSSELSTTTEHGYASECGVYNITHDQTDEQSVSLEKLELQKLADVFNRSNRYKERRRGAFSSF